MLYVITAEASASSLQIKSGAGVMWWTPDKAAKGSDSPKDTLTTNLVKLDKGTGSPSDIARQIAESPALDGAFSYWHKAD